MRWKEGRERVMKGKQRRQSVGMRDKDRKGREERGKDTMQGWEGKRKREEGGSM